MKKVKKFLCHGLMALVASVVVFGGFTAKAESPSNVNDTVVIDYSKINPQKYTGRMLTSPDLDKIEKFNLNEQEKNCVFLAVMTQLYKAFDMECDSPNCQDSKGRIVLNKEAGQYINFEAGCSGLTCDAGSSTGTFEATYTLDYFMKKSNNNYADAIQPFFAAKKMYGVEAKDKNGKNYFKIRIKFKNPDSVVVRKDADGNIETTKSDTDFNETGYSFKVTNDGEVAITGVTDASAKKVVIPETIEHNGVTYKVTSIANKAFYRSKNVKNVTIGKNVTEIGKSAFSKCKKLKKVEIKSASLKTVGKKAFNKNSDKLVVKVPKAQYKAYKRLFKKAGMSSLKLKKVK